MDNKENGYNFLLDEDFISWRLLPTKESNEYWKVFVRDNPHLKESIEKAIVEFDAVEINRNQLPIDDKKKMYRVILSNIHRYKRRRVWQKVGSVAAVLVIGLLSIFFITREQGIGTESSIGSEFILGETLPEKEIYLISKGEK